MNISGSFGEVDKMGCPRPDQSSVDSIGRVVGRDIIRRLDPLPFLYAFRFHACYTVSFGLLFIVDFKSWAKSWHIHERHIRQYEFGFQMSH